MKTIDTFRSYKYLTTILVLNISYILIYRQKIVATFVGMAILIFIGLIGIIRKWIQPHHEISLTVILSKKNNRLSNFLLVPFLIPILFIPSFQIAFWNFNAIGKIILSWFIFSILWLNFSVRAGDNNEDGFTVSPPSVLFIIWASILWISFAWDVGGYDLFIKRFSVVGERLADIIFKIWENNPISTHWGLGFLSYKDFENHAYSNHSPLYLILTYLFAKLFQIWGGISLVAAVRLLPLLYAFFIACTIIFVFFRTKFRISFNNLITQFTLFLSVGFLLTLPDFWITLLLYNADNPFPILMCLLCMMLTYVINNEYDAKGFKLILYFVCLFSYIFGFICLITLLFFMFRKEVLSKFTDSPQKMMKILCIGFICVLISALYPKCVIMVLGYKESASSFLFRSGLDGDMTYYNNIYQAVVSPYEQHFIRPWSSLVPALLFAAIILFFDRRKNNENNLGTFDNVIFLFSPYLFLIVFFPQAASIHPYNWDYGLLFPLAFLAMNGSISQEFQQRIKGPKAYLFFLFMTALVIFNLTKIAQAAKHLG